MRGLDQRHTALATAGDWRADDRVMTITGKVPVAIIMKGCRSSYGPGRSGRLGALGATPDFYYGLLAWMPSRASADDHTTRSRLP
jgi:hypothetical protein